MNPKMSSETSSLHFLQTQESASIAPFLTIVFQTVLMYSNLLCVNPFPMYITLTTEQCMSRLCIMRSKYLFASKWQMLSIKWNGTTNKNLLQQGLINYLVIGIMCIVYYCR